MQNNWLLIFWVAGKKRSGQDCWRCSGKERSTDSNIQSTFFSKVWIKLNIWTKYWKVKPQTLAKGLFYLSNLAVFFSRNTSVQVHLHNKYTKYAFLFFLCELLNLFVVVVIVFLIDRFVFIPQKWLWNLFKVPELQLPWVWVWRLAILQPSTRGKKVLSIHTRSY